jgi:hypothetical protein
VKFADVEARDQAREAEIRAIRDKVAEIRGQAPPFWMNRYFDELESLLTPSQEREPR